MTRWPRSDTNRGLSKLLKGLMGLVVIKLAVLAILMGDISWQPEEVVDAPVVSGVSLGGAVFSVNAAQAQTGDAAEAGASGTGAAGDGGTVSESGGDAVPGGSLERETLLRRQEELDRREQALNTLEAEIDAKLVRLQELEASIQRMLEQANAVVDENLRHLIDVYSNMKAKQAAAVLETLDEEIAVKILAGMNGRIAGEILSNVQSEKAARLTEALTRMQMPY